MRKFVFTLILTLVCIGFVNECHAQFGLYSIPQTIDMGQSMFGLEFVFNSAGVAGHYRAGMSDTFELGVKVGFLTDDYWDGLGGDLDFKVQVMSVERDMYPIDMSITGMFQYWHLDQDNKTSHGQFGYDEDFNYILGGAGVQMGRSFAMSGTSMIISPYTSLILGIRHAEGNSEFGGIFMLGCEMKFNQNWAGFLEFDIDINDIMFDDSGAIGVNYYM